ncbi:MAG: hypothetical protein IJC99_05090 [Clostridia bacterium]|nr:hypothetical protein [Clostridia bacterium]
MPVWPFILGGALLLVLVFVLTLHIRVSAAYSTENGIRIRIHLLFFYFTVFPRRARPLTIHLIRLGTKIGMAMLPYAKIYVPHMHIRVAAEDAAETALLYGAVSGATASALASLGHLRPTKINTKRATIVADYLSTASSVDVKFVASAGFLRAMRVLPPVLKKELPAFLTFVRERKRKEKERLRNTTKL